MFTLEAAHAPYGLAPISLSVAPGEHIALCGPNGAGKSTLIKLLAGLLKPQTGRVSIAGAQRLGVRARARQVAVVAQADTLAPGYTVADTVLMGRYAQRALTARFHASDHDAVARALSQVGLMPMRDRRVERLSGGERQRVALARALAQRAPALLLDEPTAHLDVGRAADFLALVQGLDATVVCAIHDLNLAAHFAKRVVLLRDGEVVADGTPGEVLTESRVRDVFGAHTHRVEHPHSGAPQFLPGGLSARS